MLFRRFVWVYAQENSDESQNGQYYLLPMHKLIIILVKEETKENGEDDQEVSIPEGQFYHGVHQYDWRAAKNKPARQRTVHSDTFNLKPEDEEHEAKDKESYYPSLHSNLNKQIMSVISPSIWS